MGGEQAASVLATVRRENIESGGGAWSQVEEEEFKQPIREQYERGRQSLLRDGAALGRWHHRAGRDAAGLVARAERGAERADPADEVWGFQNVILRDSD